MLSGFTVKLGQTLDECATKYRGFCKRYRPPKKQQQSSRWGSKFLGNIPKTGNKRVSPGQMPLPGWQYQVSKINNEQVSKVGEVFILANRGGSG